MPSRELTAAVEAAAAAAEVIRPFYRSALAVRTKADDSPVTDADVRAEQVIRAALERHCPGYGFYGEETGQHAMQQSHVWLVDPIDGTKGFIRGTPYFSTQIALLRDGALVLGVSSAPAVEELAYAESGSGAFLNGERVQVSAVAELSQAHVSTGNLKSLAASARWGRLAALIGRVARIRGYGDFVHYHLLARGALEAVIESDVNILDIAALAVIVREAGGLCTDLEGEAVGLGTHSVLASNVALHAQLLAALRP
ncbi:MAG: inositol-phosphate phosphatase [Gammaproteobacteria bacterium]|nr:inositol-phosphate phosphatase [Gammaproteobacteria bacterium]MBV9621435.1 inositol-phosphate phosphatase [Gammaproteobacteria bacterium]